MKEWRAAFAALYTGDMGKGMRAALVDETLITSASVRFLRWGRNCVIIRTGPLKLISISRVCPPGRGPG